MKKILIITIIVSVLCGFAISSAQAAEWPVIGQVVQVGTDDDGAPYVVVKDASSNYWGLNLATTGQSEMLATALTAASSGEDVVAIIEDTVPEYVGIYINTEI